MTDNQINDNSSEEHLQTILELLATLDKSNIMGAFQLLEGIESLPVSVTSYLFAISLFFPDDYICEQSREVMECTFETSNDLYALSYNFDLEYHLDNESRMSEFLEELREEFPLDTAIVGNIALQLLNTGWMFCLKYHTATAYEFQDWIQNKELSLDNLDIEEVPPAVGKLINLDFLFLELNHLENLPEEIGKLKYLKRLYLNDNFLKEFPESICQLHNLRELRLEHNKIEFITPEIWQLQNLEVLHLSYNRLKELPEEITQLSKLRRLWLVGNHFTGAEKVKIKKMFNTSSVQVEI